MFIIPLNNRNDTKITARGVLQKYIVLIFFCRTANIDRVHQYVYTISPIIRLE